MNIDRPRLKKIISAVPRELRNGARMERQVIERERQSNPILASFKESHGLYDLKKNEELTAKLDELRRKLALDNYVKSQPFSANTTKVENVVDDFVQRQPFEAL